METRRSSERVTADKYSVQNRTVSRPIFSHSVGMKKKELNSEQISVVPCPTCGAAAGEACVLHSGGPRSGPHVDRKFSAAEAIERK